MATLECCSAIATLITSNTFITSLNLSDNPLSTSVSEAVGAALKSNRSIKFLGLASAGMMDSSTLFEGLAGHPVETLDISNNPCGPRSFAKLGQSMSSGLALKSLVAKNVDMRNEGAAALAEGIRNRRSLTSLDVTRAALGPQGLGDLVDALACGLAVVRVAAGDNPAGPPTPALIRGLGVLLRERGVR
eukprot:CAMPEP_0113671472 /NCGR_PEP_ID=MMETSP0038_2-20120614/5723_1 /TAXON_ID=2898 /ORGANISM="Cryptomonas paramecium" /LENGTH=188 /DNA_ID=CAMNT_0000587627 /DNA_START=268 /DNA_END=830 /DNA_ORIENTATION=- /assembly_acc=CAM_ASM_000170